MRPPSLQNDQICSVPSSVQQLLDRKASELKASPIFVGARGGNSVALCGPVCIYEWLSLGAKPQNNAATLKGWFSYGRGHGDGDDGGGSGGGGGGAGSLFPTVGAWYREWREVLLAAGWCDALHVSVRGKAARTGAAERLEVGHGHLHRWAAAVYSHLLVFLWPRESLELEIYLVRKKEEDVDLCWWDKWRNE